MRQRGRRQRFGLAAERREVLQNGIPDELLCRLGKSHGEFDAEGKKSRLRSLYSNAVLGWPATGVRGRPGVDAGSTSRKKCSATCSITYCASKFCETKDVKCYLHLFTCVLDHGTHAQKEYAKKDTVHPYLHIFLTRGLFELNNVLRQTAPNSFFPIAEKPEVLFQGKPVFWIS
ncbi:hypothetical protein CEXT_555631 [Caerostris extrusa]|uniref:Uncharacterized protein n=1 Tax=Caerostris extrusa TaxID=172846 RepID=A0AAV4SR00_CAEEX|nr:hypothetical protein CEXT_555631 [Caerostris extrusa]